MNLSELTHEVERSQGNATRRLAPLPLEQVYLVGPANCRAQARLFGDHLATGLARCSKVVLSATVNSTGLARSLNGRRKHCALGSALLSGKFGGEGEQRVFAPAMTKIAQRFSVLAFLFKKCQQGHKRANDFGGGNHVFVNKVQAVP